MLEQRNQTRNVPGLIFRGLRGEEDYSLLADLTMKSFQADQIMQTVLAEDMGRWYAPSERFDPSRDLLIASIANIPGGEPSVLGYSRVSWYSGPNSIRLYYQDVLLPPEWRKPEIYQAIIMQNEHRLREIAAGHLAQKNCFFQAWATDTEVGWPVALESEGYQVVRRFHNMLHRMEEIPERPLPAGFEVRPVQPEHLRLIWEAQKEVTRDLFETVAEAWTEEKYQAWLVNPSHTPQLWQVAWDGDEVAGMVLTRIDEDENRERNRKHGYTEHIFVRSPWRKRGLASALIVRSLKVLKAQGMDEAELGVDAENESAAFGLYQRLGYQTFSIDTWFRKPMG